jgi:predicted O-linked N-acetylglucosamine transferase (SPINDLY family)
MGTPSMDYIIADPVLIPELYCERYSEKILYLPNSYQVNDSKRELSPRRFCRQELELPRTGFIFCCFNNSWKILPEMFYSWIRILHTVPNSVLWLYEDNPLATENLKLEASKKGLSKDRLVFARRMPNAQHLARYELANLFLDTSPYGAHTTASDALWAGLPVLTRLSESFASRVASSLLRAIGLPELITESLKDYESMAIELALNPDKYSLIRAKVGESRFNSTLFDTVGFTKDIESSYRVAYDRYCLGFLPKSTYINSKTVGL